MVDFLGIHNVNIKEVAAAFPGSKIISRGNEIRIQYGGSVNASNAAEIFAADNVDGALVGGASLTAEKFLPIVEAAARG